MGYTINTAAEVMSANVFALYEEAKARQWNAARDIPWSELPADGSGRRTCNVQALQLP